MGGPRSNMTGTLIGGGDESTDTRMEDDVKTREEGSHLEAK